MSDALRTRSNCTRRWQQSPTRPDDSVTQKDRSDRLQFHAVSSRSLEREMVLFIANVARRGVNTPGPWCKRLRA